MSSTFSGTVTADAFSSTTATVTDLVMAAGGSINLDSATATLSSNAATITKRAVQVTSEALTTAAGASQAMALTLSGVTATDIVMVSKCGGTNTQQNFQLVAVATTDTVTVTLYNTEPTNAINGTVKFNVLVFKA